MKKDAVKIGGVYRAKVSNKIVSVRIDAESRHGGWEATNLETRKKVRINTAQRLRSEVKPKRAAGKAADQPKPVSDATTNQPNPAATRRFSALAAAKSKRISALDAAARVLADERRPMHAKELITAMAERGLWTTPAGKTPEATLHAALCREIKTRGPAARFIKAARGEFAIAKTIS